MLMSGRVFCNQAETDFQTQCLSNALTIRRFLDWGGRGVRALDPLLLRALDFHFFLAVQFARAGFHQQAAKPFHYFRLSSKPQNPKTWTRSSSCSYLHNYPPCLLTYDVSGHMIESKRLRRMSYEDAFKTAFRAKKGTKKHSKNLVSVSVCHLRYSDVIPKKWHFSRQLHFK